MKMKRILSFLLAFLMVVQLFPAAYAMEETPAETAAVTEESTLPTETTAAATETTCAAETVATAAETAPTTAATEAPTEATAPVTEPATEAATQPATEAPTEATIPVTEAPQPSTEATTPATEAEKETTVEENVGAQAKTPAKAETAPEAHPMVGKYVKLSASTMFGYVADPNWSYVIVGSYPAFMEISEVLEKDGVTYYRLKAAPNYTWPTSGGYSDDTVYLEATKLVVVTWCAECEEYDCGEDHSQPENICEICGEHDCIKIHFWCELCEKHDCGESHILCPACGAVDCETVHTFCPHCGIYDCGMEHVDEYKPDTAPVIPENPTLTPNADVSIVDEYGDAVTEAGLFLEDGTKTCISAWPVGEADSYQWQICYNNANDLWANIQGETGKGILISPAMFLNIISYQGTAAIRCVATVGGETKISASIPVTVMEAVPQQEMMMFASRPSTESAATPTADVEYSIVIDYKFRDDSKAANSWTASLAQGADYILDVESPAVVGYKPDQARITETITNFTGTRIITVYYDPDIVEFKVIHHQQNITGNEYTVYRTDTKQGYTGTQVGADLQESFVGFDQLNYDDTLVIAADGSTVVNIYYDREYYIVRLNLNGGFGAEPICARYGTPVNIADPQRTGYAFAGWSPALPTFIEKETTHTAQWTKADTGFTVAFYYENPNDEEYSFVGSVQQTATTGSKVNGADYKDAAFEGRDNEHFTYEKADTNVEIAADGSTVVNVYFTRNSYTLTYYKWKCLHTHTNDCCNLQHIHNQTAGACCNIHVHTWSCLATPTSGSYASANSSYLDEIEDACPNPKEGQLVTIKPALLNRHFVYFNGQWWQNKGNNTYGIEWNSCGGNPQPPHEHGSGCNTSGCGKTAHDHSSGKLANCNGNACKHSAYFGCESDISNMNHWTVFYQGSFKYGQDVSAIHAAQGTERWCPGACEGLKDADGNYYASYGQSPAHGVYSSMGGGDVVFFQGGAGPVEYKLTFWLETYDGSGSRNYNGKNFAQGTTFTAKMGAVGYQGDYVAGCPEPGFTVYEAWTSDSIGGANGVQLPVGGSYAGNTYIYYNFYYARATYDLTYFNGSNVVATRSMKYDEPLTSTYNLQNLSMTSPYGDGYYFAGWYLDPECNVPVSWGSTRMADGGLAVYAKWAPTTHTVTTYQTKGGTKLNTYSITHGEAYSGTVNKPTNGVLNFVGWFYEENGEKKTYDFSMPVYKDMVLWAEWTSDVQVPGTITYIDRATGKVLAQPSPISGQVGSTKTYEAKIGSQLVYEGQVFTGYFPEVTSHNIEFSANEGQNDWIFYYNAMKDVPYEVRYINGATGEAMADSDYGTTNEPSLSFKAKTFKGYSADAYEKTLIVSSDESLNVVIFTYTEDTVHAPVQVVHYIQNTTGDGYTRYLTEEAYQGTIGQEQYKTPLAIDGFRYNQDMGNNGTELTEDGLQLELYYDRNTYSYKFLFEDNAGNTLRSAVEGSGLYGSLVEYTTQSIPGYRLTTPGTLTITIGTNSDNNVKTFVYEERTVTIRYEVGAVDGGTVTPESEAVLAVKGKADGAEAETKDNYIFVGWYTDYACTEANKVGSNATFTPERNADGVYVDAVYYAKFEEVKVTLNYSVVMPSGATEEATLTKTSEQVSIYTGRATGSSVETVPDGYQFDGWYDADGNKLTGSTTWIPPRTDDPWQDGTTYYARFIEKPATINYVAVGNGSVTPGTEEVNMVTGTASGATATATENIARFVGWYDNAACEGTALSTDAAFAPSLPSGGWVETQTYYAKFENISYTITFVDRDSTVKTQDYVHGDTLTLPEVTNGDYLVTWTVKETSGDWEQGAKVKNGVINHYGDVTLVANWTITAIWVDWDFNFLEPNEADVLYTKEQIPYGEHHVYAGVLTTEQLAERRNNDEFTYTFKEWAEVNLSYFETQFEEEIKGIVVYRAVYEKTPVPYSITLHLNGGELPDNFENPIPYHCETEEFNLPDPTRAGYEFLGWAETENATPGTNPVTIPKGTTGNKEFYAVWKLSQSNLTITVNDPVAGQNYIFVVKKENTEVAKVTLYADKSSITIRDLPVGDYTVTPVSGWAWRLNITSEDNTADLIDQNEVTFTCSGNGLVKWLNGFNDNGKKGG